MPEAIKARRSVRTFDGNPLTSDDFHAIADIVEDACNPFGVGVDFRVLDAASNNLKSPAIVGETCYAAAKVHRVKNFEIAFGYAFERFCLQAQAKGFGTVMLAASLNREAFERAMELSPDEVMPVATPIGRAAEKQSVRERAMRRALGADGRLPFDELFFRGSFYTPLAPVDSGALELLLEAVRLAPSAGNKQPWRAVVAGDDANTVHFYEARSMKDSPLGDIQKVDVGIALAHFDLVAQELGISVEFVQSDPGIAVPDNVAYIMSCKVVR
ncbi:MAG: nitroreductase family protein [Eggerthellaceae bacterium]|nr:nitroreductase family protein [Eggerthellaceae bacterium]